jgi:hypothetical protein
MRVLMILCFFILIFNVTYSSSKSFIIWPHTSQGVLVKLGGSVSISVGSFESYEAVLSTIQGELKDDFKSYKGALDGAYKSSGKIRSNLKKICEDLEIGDYDWHVSDVVDINFHSFKGRPRELSRWLNAYPSVRCIVDLKKRVVPVPWRQAAWNSFSQSFWATGSYISSLWAKKKK